MGRSRDRAIELSIIIPSIDGREHWLKRALKGFRRETPVEYEPLVILNQPTCGEAWNVGIEASVGDYILLAADDLEPLPGWWEAAMSAIIGRQLPAPRILNTDGTLQSCGDWVQEMPTGTPVTLNRIPFAPHGLMKKIYPILPIHYATDYWFSHRARQEGWESVIQRDFCFYHHFAEQGRLDHRLNEDMQTFWSAAGFSGAPRPG